MVKYTLIIISLFYYIYNISIYSITSMPSMPSNLAFLGKVNCRHKNGLFSNTKHLSLSSITGRRNCIARNVATMNIPILNGLDVGIPLNIIDNIFTNLHYGHDITTPKIILLQFLIGYYTYGKDRYKDALEYYDIINSEIRDEFEGDVIDVANFEIKDEKKELYKQLYDNDEFYDKSYCLVFYCIMFLLFNDDYWYLNLPAAGLLYSTEYYKQLKGQIVGFKPIFVASMWTFSSVILPCILHDHNYSILSDVGDYLPCFLVLFAFTNLADIKDIGEDIANEVNTVPVVFGKRNTQILVLLCLALSSYMFGTHPHYYDRSLINAGFELQNGLISIITFLL